MGWRRILTAVVVVAVVADTVKGIVEVPFPAGIVIASEAPKELTQLTSSAPCW